MLDLLLRLDDVLIPCPCDEDIWQIEVRKRDVFLTSCVAPVFSRLYADRIAATAGNEGAVV